MENNQPLNHDIHRIVQVELPADSAQYQRQESRFLVQFYCQCCIDQEIWLTRTQLVQNYRFQEQRLRQIEESAYKEKREQETRQNAEELLKYLDFADIDWKNLQDTEFQEVNFVSDSENQTEDIESQCEVDLKDLIKNFNEFSSTKILQLQQDSALPEIRNVKSQTLSKESSQQLGQADPKTEIEEEKDSQSLPFPENSEDFQEVNQDLTSFITPCQRSCQNDQDKDDSLASSSLKNTVQRKKRLNKRESKQQQKEILKPSKFKTTHERDTLKNDKQKPVQIFKIITERARSNYNNPEASPAKSDIIFKRPRMS